MFAQGNYFQQINQERTLADFIPYSSHISANTIVTKEGDYLRIWKIGGISHEGADPELIQIRVGSTKYFMEKYWLSSCFLMDTQRQTSGIG